MGVEDDEDRLSFLDTDEFGKEVLVGPGSSPLQGILIRKFVPSGEFAGNRPVFHCRELDTDGLSVAPGMALVDDSDNYIVRELQPDGTGMIDLVLEGPT